MSSGEPSISAISLSVTGARLVYDGAPLFDGLDFELRTGRFTCLLGPSGVGKSSLLRLVAGLQPAEPPTVLTWHSSNRIAYLAQHDLLLPWLTVLENVILGYRLRQDAGIGAARRRALDMLAQVGLAAESDRMPAALSGGMRQRVALARTLVEDRPVVLMDEPFSQLDAITRLDLQDLAATLLADRTVLLVTHDPLEALRLGHRIHVLAGRPATLGAAIEPPGPTPRDPADPQLLKLQAELIARLRAARRLSA